jgi:hypothetical protein
VEVAAGCTEDSVAFIRFSFLLGWNEFLHLKKSENKPAAFTIGVQRKLEIRSSLIV